MMCPQAGWAFTKLLAPKNTLFITRKHPDGEAKMEVFLTVEVRDVREWRAPKFEILDLKFRRTRTSDLELSCAN